MFQMHYDQLQKVYEKQALAALTFQANMYENQKKELMQQQKLALEYQQGQALSEKQKFEQQLLAAQRERAAEAKKFEQGQQLFGQLILLCLFYICYKIFFFLKWRVIYLNSMWRIPKKCCKQMQLCTYIMYHVL